jgi:transposase
VAKVQKVYTKACKEEAIKLAKNSGKSIAQIARELDISDSALYNWQKQRTEEGSDAFPGTGGHQSEPEEEIHR